MMISLMRGKEFISNSISIFAKRLLLVVAAVLLMTNAAHAQRWDNYKPDNPNVVCRSTNLPVVLLQVDGAMIERYYQITARMTIIDNGAGQYNYPDTLFHPGQRIDYDGYIALRYRGNSSFTLSDKKPYDIRTLAQPLEEGGEKQKVKLLGMPKDNHWALLAPYSDKSMMRDLLAFEVSRPWMEYTPQGRFCEVYLDGTYYGVFIFTEVVSKGKHRLNLTDPGNEGDALTGGYLMEVDRDDEVVHVSKYSPMSKTGQKYNGYHIYFQYKSPDYEDLTTEQVAYINGRIDAMEDVLNSTNYRDPETGYRKYLDMLNFVDYQIAMELGHNVDGYRLSGKFFKRTDDVDPRFKMVLWDMNLAYGNSDYYNGWRTDTWIYQSNNTLYSNGDSQLVPFWWYKLNNDSEYTALLKLRWAQYRRSNLREDRLMAKIDSMATVLTKNGAERRNSQAWPRWGVYVWPNYHVSTSFSDEIAYLKNWLTQRIAWMDEKLGYDPNAVQIGDVNCDGVVDVSDLSAIIDYLLQGGTIDVDAADCNHDGTVDVSDVSTLGDYLLTGNWP